MSPLDATPEGATSTALARLLMEQSIEVLKALAALCASSPPARPATVSIRPSHRWDDGPGAHP